MKKHLFTFLLLLGCTLAVAQQKALYSQYMTNYYLLNPAVTGFDKDLSFKAGFRNQWVGFEGAPTTFYLSGETALFQNTRGRGQRSVKPFHGVGGYAYTDITGPTTRSAALLSYAYHVPLDRELYLSAGMFAGFQQFRFNPNKVMLADNSNERDPVTSGGVLNAFMPDLSLGVFLHSDKYFAGISLFQALGNKFFSVENSNAASHLTRHLFVSGGYHYDVTKTITLSPSVLLKYGHPAPLQADFNIKASKNFTRKRKTKDDDQLWVGLSYRTQDALVGLVGVQFREQYQVSYSYDITVSPIRNHSSGSHELTVGFRVR